MGCLPPIVLVLAGYGVGYFCAGKLGAMIGAGIGLALGLLVGIPLLLTMRRANRQE